MAEPIHLLNLPKKHVLSQTHLENVEITNPADKEVLTYESATSKWKNKAVPAGGYQPQSVNQSATVAPASATWTDVPGLTLTLAPGTYIFAVNILYVKTGAGFNICDRRIRVVDASHTLIMSQTPYFSFSTGILTNWTKEMTLIRSFQVSAETTFHVECYAVVEIMHSHNFQSGNFSVFPL